jgi:hypothetical protein
MILDLEFLRKYSVEAMVELARSKHVEFCFWMKSTIEFVSSRVSHFGYDDNYRTFSNFFIKKQSNAKTKNNCWKRKFGKEK